MASKSQEARRKERLEQRDAERKRRSEAFEERNASAGVKARARRLENANERQTRVTASRLKRKQEFDARNVPAAAEQAKGEPGPRYFSNKEEPPPRHTKDLGRSKRSVPAGLEQGRTDRPDPGAGALEGVQFASPQAREKALVLGLTADSFARRRQTSDHGFNVGDVERVAASLGADDADEDETGGEEG